MHTYLSCSGLHTLLEITKEVDSFGWPVWIKRYLDARDTTLDDAHDTPAIGPTPELPRKNTTAKAAHILIKVSHKKYEVLNPHVTMIPHIPIHVSHRSMKYWTYVCIGYHTVSCLNLLNLKRAYHPIYHAPKNYDVWTYIRLWFTQSHVSIYRI